jgi:hypothetical protein
MLKIGGNPKTRLRWTSFLAGVLIAVVLTGCAQEMADTEVPTTQEEWIEVEVLGTDEDIADAIESEGTESPVDAMSTKAALKPESTPNRITDPQERKFVIVSKEDLAERLNVGIGQVRFMSIQAVVWPDASLGCPQPGMMYAQVLTPGYRIILKVDGQEYFYHTDEEDALMLCELEDLPELPSLQLTPGAIDDGKPWKPVD